MSEDPHVPLQSATLGLHQRQLAAAGGGENPRSEDDVHVRREANLKKWQERKGRQSGLVMIGDKRYYRDRKTDFLYEAVGANYEIGKRVGKLETKMGKGKVRPIQAEEEEEEDPE